MSTFKEGESIDGVYKVIKVEHDTPDAHIYLVAARDLDDKPYWVKVWRKEVKNWSRQQERIEAELRVMQLLSNPYFIQPVRIGKLPDGRPYLVVEHTDGQLMVEAIATPKDSTGPMTPERAVDLALQLVHCVSVAYAYKKVLHCGLNPKAMYLRRDGGNGQLLIVDLQYAKVDGKSAQDDLDPLPADVMRFAAPELASDPSCSDVNTEVYSIIANLRYWITGEWTIPGDDDVEVYANVLNWQPPPLRKHRRGADVPPLLEEIVLRGLSKFSDERFQSFQELHSALAAVQWHYCSQRLESGTTVEGAKTSAMDPMLVAAYLNAGRELLERRRSSELIVPMRIVEQLERETQTPVRRVATIVDGFASRDMSALTAAERAAIEKVLEIQKKQ